jgi:FkbM family methyltransferase
MDIVEYFDGHTGHYIDIGAGDPIRESNTFPLYCLGCSGLLIDALPERCEILRRERPRDTVINAVLSNQKVKRTLFKNGDFTSVTPNWTPSIKGVIEVETVTLKEIIKDNDSFGVVDFLSIDVEGHEKEVLEGIDFNLIRPNLIVIEALECFTGVPRWPLWEHILLDNKYALLADMGLNRFYARNIE